MSRDVSNSLCLECGLCCNGVIFANVQLQPADDARRLRALGLAFTSNPKAKNQKFKQPCAAFDGCRCNIYPDRPKYCREFECLLLKSVKAGRTETNTALKVIRATRKRVDKVKGLLRELGDTDDGVSLGHRFRRVQRRFENSAQDDGAVRKFGDLTLAFHDLNVLLSGKFYPAP